MNKMKRIVLASSLAVLASCATTSFASDSTSECTTYLGWSDSEFLSQVSSDKSTAQTVTTALTNCLHENDCVSITDSISDCDTLLANRLYAASFYATKLALDSSTTSSSSASTSAPSTSSAAPSSSSNTSSSSTTSSTSDTGSSTSSTSSDINW